MHLILVLSSLEHLKEVPPRFWAIIIGAVVLIVLIKLVIATIQNSSKILVGSIAFIGISITVINWVYNRTEPSWATPVISKIANCGFLPTKGQYQEVQTHAPDDPKTNPKK